MFHLLKWLYPGMKMKRWLLLFAVGVMMFSFGSALVINYEYLGRAEEEIFMLVCDNGGRRRRHCDCRLVFDVVVNALNHPLDYRRDYPRPSRKARRLDLSGTKTRTRSGSHGHWRRTRLERSFARN